MSNIRDGKAGGPCGPVRDSLVKHAGQADLFNLLTRISSRPARASSEVGQAGPRARKKKKIVIVLMCADDEEDYNYEKMDESSSKVASNVIEMEECQ